MTTPGELLGGVAGGGHRRGGKKGRGGGLSKSRVSAGFVSAFTGRKIGGGLRRTDRSKKEASEIDLAPERLSGPG